MESGVKTKLFNPEYFPAGAFGDIYRQRWRINCSVSRADPNYYRRSKIRNIRTTERNRPANNTPCGTNPEPKNQEHIISR
jgi:hypothetical protein